MHRSTKPLKLCLRLIRRWWQDAATILATINIWVPWSKGQGIAMQASNLLCRTYWQPPLSSTCTSLYFSGVCLGSVWGAANKILWNVDWCSPFCTNCLLTPYGSTVFFIGWFRCTSATYHRLTHFFNGIHMPKLLHGAWVGTSDCKDGFSQLQLPLATSCSAMLFLRRTNTTKVNNVFVTFAHL